jgi:DNA-directed RNA polymerase subunit E'/Rpb7
MQSNTMDKYTISKRFKKTIQLKPSLLSINIEEYISNILREQQGTNFVEIHGYTMNTPHIISIGDMVVSYTGCCKIEVEYECDTLKPDIGHIYNTCIKRIYEEGIFAQTNEIHILILIPESELDGWIFTPDKYSKDGRDLEIGDWINVEIINTLYVNHTYQCIGKLVI